MDVFSDTQKREFLEGLRRGERPDKAALAVGGTSSAFRRLANRDEEFRALFDLAHAERREAHADKIRSELDARSFDRSDPASFQCLRLEAEMYLEELEHKRTKTVRHGNDGQPFQIQAVVPSLTQEMIDKIPVAILRDMKEKLDAIEAGDIERLHELAEGVGL